MMNVIHKGDDFTMKIQLSSTECQWGNHPCELQLQEKSVNDELTMLSGCHGGIWMRTILSSVSVSVRGHQPGRQGKVLGPHSTHWLSNAMKKILILCIRNTNSCKPHQYIQTNSISQIASLNTSLPVLFSICAV